MRGGLWRARSAAAPARADWVPGRLVVCAHGPEFIPMMEAAIRGLGSTIADTAHDRDNARGISERLQELGDDCQRRPDAHR